MALLHCSESAWVWPTVKFSLCVGVEIDPYSWEQTSVNLAPKLTLFNLGLVNVSTILGLVLVRVRCVNVLNLSKLIWPWIAKD